MFEKATNKKLKATEYYAAAQKLKNYYKQYYTVEYEKKFEFNIAAGSSNTEHPTQPAAGSGAKAAIRSTGESVEAESGAVARSASKSSGSKGKGNALKNIIKNLDDIVKDPKKLKGLSPKEVFQYLKDNGYNPVPLNDGSLKGKPFEERGGFKVNWGGDRILQYHPAGGRLGGGEYWKISSGKTGTNRYEKLWYNYRD